MDNKEINRAEVASLMERILYEVKKIIVGQDHFLERVLVAVLAQGHLLVEGVPGPAVQVLGAEVDDWPRL